MAAWLQQGTSDNVNAILRCASWFWHPSTVHTCDTQITPHTASHSVLPCPLSSTHCATLLCRSHVSACSKELVVLLLQNVFLDETGNLKLIDNLNVCTVKA